MAYTLTNRVLIYGGLTVFLGKNCVQYKHYLTSQPIGLRGATCANPNPHKKGRAFAIGRHTINITREAAAGAKLRLA